MEQTIKAIIRRIENEPSRLELYEDFFECLKLMRNEDKELAYKNAEPIADKIDEVLTGESKKE